MMGTMLRHILRSQQIPLVTETQGGEVMGDFDSSDDDNVENLPPLPHDQFRIDWLNLPRLGLHNTLALSALPGCRLLSNRVS